ncbi:hypothetical protein [Jannaschia ovalis]|uniref:Uncharacterized protein n=1 Tax=Jannaschia ovalis TaxID=3038773 RepID=A0ABY8LA20_9RHOB|nr:hypothetical protein [Jannaschia sp. GRR-S6-38]WGH77971.1 hypothetical protein P8627_13150 [Jannaschia sp. GRR-S6-38]
MSAPRNPLSLSEKGARYGAVAFFAGALILAWPVSEGWRAAQAGLEAPQGTSGWAELRRFGWQMAREGAE